MSETAPCALNVEKLGWRTTLDTATAVEAKYSTTVIGGLIHRYLTQISFGSGVGLYDRGGLGGWSGTFRTGEKVFGTGGCKVAAR